MIHYSVAQLQEFVDGLADDRRAEEIELHVRMCDRCRAGLRAVRGFDRMLRRLPHDRPSPIFTARVLDALRIRESPSLAWTVLRNLAPLVALAFLAGIAILILRLTGSPVPQPSGVSDSITGPIGEAVSAGTAYLTRWLSTVVPFARSGYGLAFLVLIGFAVVGLLDRLVFLRLVKRKPT